MSHFQRFAVVTVAAMALYILVFRSLMLTHAQRGWVIDVLFWLILLPPLAYVTLKHGRRRGVSTMTGLVGGFAASFFAGHLEFFYSEGLKGLAKLQAVPEWWELALGLLIRPLLMFGWILGFFYGLALEDFRTSQREK